MKTLLLFRHSKPLPGPVPDADRPLSPEGIAAAQAFFDREPFSGVSAVVASPYRRAWETAQLFGMPFTTDVRLAERCTGDTTGQDASFWKRQYDEPDFKNPDGESLREAGTRVVACAAEVLARLPEGGSAALFSHAGSICGFLMHFCTITVTDLQTKRRKIAFHGKTVLDGTLNAPSCFVVQVEGNAVVGMEYRE